MHAAAFDVLQSYCNPEKTLTATADEIGGRRESSRTPNLTGVADAAMQWNWEGHRPQNGLEKFEIDIFLRFSQ